MLSNFKKKYFSISIFILSICIVEGQGCSNRRFKQLEKAENFNTEQTNEIPLGVGEPDVYFDYEWYLGGKNISTSVNLGVPEVWSSLNFGQDSQITIIDPSSIYLDHKDLTSNKDSLKSFNFIFPDKGIDTTFTGGSSHGTCVAGVLGARELNGKGIRGISSRAKISGRTTTGIDSDIYDALTYKINETEIVSNSYGPPDDVSELNQYYNQTLFDQGIDLSLKNGRDGLGTVFVWAAGNGRMNSDRSNYDGYASNYGVMSICSISSSGNISSFSEPGSNLWVCAPGEKIVATDFQSKNCSDTATSSIKDLPDSDYTQNFTGTSASTPIVSGVVGLLLTEAKKIGKSLGWRDVKMILAESATKTNSVLWQQTRIKYNDDFGFGIINAAEALRLLNTWSPVGNSPWIASVLGSGLLSPTLSGSLTDGGTSYLPMKNFTINNAMTEDGIAVFHSAINYIEAIKLELKLSHTDPGDLEINLVKTSLTGGQRFTSKIATPHNCIDNGTFVSCTSVSNYLFEFGVSNFLGESAQGIWSLEIADKRANGKIGSVVGWRLNLYGH